MIGQTGKSGFEYSKVCPMRGHPWANCASNPSGAAALAGRSQGRHLCSSVLATIQSQRLCLEPRRISAQRGLLVSKYLEPSRAQCCAARDGLVSWWRAYRRFWPCRLIRRHAPSGARCGAGNDQLPPGPWGFLAHPALSKESSHNSSGNYGLLDKIAALNWVRDNISALAATPTM